MAEKQTSTKKKHRSPCMRSPSHKPVAAAPAIPADSADCPVVISTESSGSLHPDPRQWRTPDAVHSQEGLDEKISQLIAEALARCASRPCRAGSCRDSISYCKQTHCSNIHCFYVRFWHGRGSRPVRADDRRPPHPPAGPPTPEWSRQGETEKDDPIGPAVPRPWQFKRHSACAGAAW